MCPEEPAMGSSRRFRETREEGDDGAREWVVMEGSVERQPRPVGQCVRERLVHGALQATFLSAKRWLEVNVLQVFTLSPACTSLPNWLPRATSLLGSLGTRHLLTHLWCLQIHSWSSWKGGRSPARNSSSSCSAASSSAPVSLFLFTSSGLPSQSITIPILLHKEPMLEIPAPHQRVNTG